MDILKAAALEFKILLNTKYVITMGRKGKKYTITLEFSTNAFFHMAGLHKLQDRPNYIGMNNTEFFNSVLADAITYADIEKSSYIVEAHKRLLYLQILSSLIEDNTAQFKWMKNVNKNSKINCDFLLVSKFIAIEPYPYTETYLFLDKPRNNKDENPSHFCKTFFPKEFVDYTTGQTKVTLLKKDRIDTNSNVITNIYTNPSYNETPEIENKYLDMD